MPQYAATTSYAPFSPVVLSVSTNYSLYNFEHNADDVNLGCRYKNHKRYPFLASSVQPGKANSESGAHVQTYARAQTYFRGNQRYHLMSDPFRLQG